MIFFLIIFLKKRIKESFSTPRGQQLSRIHGGKPFLSPSVDSLNTPTSLLGAGGVKGSRESGDGGLAADGDGDCAAELLEAGGCFAEEEPHFSGLCFLLSAHFLFDCIAEILAIGFSVFDD